MFFLKEFNCFYIVVSRASFHLCPKHLTLAQCKQFKDLHIRLSRSNILLPPFALMQKAPTVVGINYAKRSMQIPQYAGPLLLPGQRTT
jgi:hypothetical protein